MSVDFILPSMPTANLNTQNKEKKTKQNKNKIRKEEKRKEQRRNRMKVELDSKIFRGQIEKKWNINTYV